MSMTPGDPLGGPPTPPQIPGSSPDDLTPPGYTSPAPPGATNNPFGQPAQPPSPVLGQHRLSGWWRRAAAYIIDSLIILALSMILLIPLGIGIFATDENASDTDIGALVGGAILTVLIITVVAFIYAPTMLSRTNGKTVGRMVAGTRLIRADGQRMTFGRAFVREVLLKALTVGIINSFTFGLASLVDFLWPLWDDENRCLHDFPVDTRTILD